MHRFISFVFVFPIHYMGFNPYFIIILSLDFVAQVGVRRTRSNAKPKVHTGIDFFFMKMFGILWVLRILTSSSSDHVWNKQNSSCFEVLFVFADAKLHDSDVIVFVHVVDPNVFRSI